LPSNLKGVSHGHHHKQYVGGGSALLVSLVKAMLGVNAVKPLSRLVNHALVCVDKYDLTDAHLAAIFALESTRLKS